MKMSFLSERCGCILLSIAFFRSGSKIKARIIRQHNRCSIVIFCTFQNIRTDAILAKFVRKQLKRNPCKFESLIIGHSDLPTICCFLMMEDLRMSLKSGILYIRRKPYSRTLNTVLAFHTVEQIYVMHDSGFFFKNLKMQVKINPFFLEVSCSYILRVRAS